MVETAGSGDKMIYELPLPPSVNRYWRSYRGRVVVSAAAKAYRATVAALMHTHQLEPLAGPVCVSITVYRERKAGDLDNRIKIVLDAMQGIFYTNDKQVTELHCYLADDKHKPRCIVDVVPTTPDGRGRHAAPRGAV